ncbi:hypothetical protein ACJX0J_023157, partial [Zea mays]
EANAKKKEELRGHLAVLAAVQGKAQGKKKNRTNQSHACSKWTSSPVHYSCLNNNDKIILGGAAFYPVSKVLDMFY